MPYRELTLIDVKEVVRRWSAGQGDRKIGAFVSAGRPVSRAPKVAFDAFVLDAMIDPMPDQARTLAHPALESIRNAPKGGPSLLTDEDRARIAANQEARRLGSKAIPHEAVMGELEDRERREHTFAIVAPAECRGVLSPRTLPRT